MVFCKVGNRILLCYRACIENMPKPGEAFHEIPAQPDSFFSATAQRAAQPCLPYALFADAGYPDSLLFRNLPSDNEP